MKKNLILIIIILLLNIIASNSTDFASWYATNVSKTFVNTIGELVVLCPFQYLNG